MLIESNDWLRVGNWERRENLRSRLGHYYAKTYPQVIKSMLIDGFLYIHKDVILPPDFPYCLSN